MWASWPARLATATGSTLRHSSIRNLTITGLAASGRRDRRTVRPWLLARPAPQWVGGGIDRGQADHLGGDNLTQKPCHLIINSHDRFRKPTTAARPWSQEPLLMPRC